MVVRMTEGKNVGKKVSECLAILCVCVCVFNLYCVRFFWTGYCQEESLEKGGQCSYPRFFIIFVQLLLQLRAVFVLLCFFLNNTLSSHTFFDFRIWYKDTFPNSIDIPRFLHMSVLLIFSTSLIKGDFVTLKTKNNNWDFSLWPSLSTSPTAHISFISTLLINISTQRNDIWKMAEISTQSPKSKIYIFLFLLGH